MREEQQRELCRHVDAETVREAADARVHIDDDERIEMCVVNSPLLFFVQTRCFFFSFLFFLKKDAKIFFCFF